MKLSALIKLIRLPNVLMVMLTMYLMRWSIVVPLLDLIGYDPVMPEWTFALLVFSTATITAAGYVINDFHDVKADRVNHPDQVVIDQTVSRRRAILYHILLNTIGVIAGVFIALYHWIPWLSLVFVAVPLLLWLYSLSIKHRMMWGNLLVSLLTATVPLLVLLFEYPLLQQAYSLDLAQQPDLFRPLIHWIGFFALFAFLTNLIRELIKDGQDMEGDAEAGSKTLAISLGIKKLKMLVLILSISTLVFLVLLFLRFLPDQLSLAYLGVLLVLPFLLLFYQIFRVKEPKDWRRVSRLAKLIMLFGLMYAPVAYFLFESLSSLL